MKPNNLIKAALAVGLTTGLMLSPVTANAAEGSGDVADIPPSAYPGQRGFFVDGLKPLYGPRVVSDSEYEKYVHPDLPFPMYTVQWPRVAFPVNGFLTFDESVERGVANTIASIEENAVVYEEFGDFVHMMCYGAGCVVAHQVKPAFEEGGELEEYELFEFTTFRDPANADGGIMTKLPFDLPGMTMINQDDYQDASVEQTVTYRYDLVSDAPDEPGLLAYANAIAAAYYYGDDYGYEQLNDAINDDRVVMTFTTEDGEVRIHYLVDDPDQGLPLTKPLRDLGLAVSQTAAGDAKVNAVWDNVDAKLKPRIDSKYDTGPDPEVNQREVDTNNGMPINPVDEEADPGDAQPETWKERRDERKAEREAKKAEVRADFEAKKAEVRAEREVKKAERKAELEAKKAEVRADFEAKKAEVRAERQQHRDGLKQDRDSCNDNDVSGGGDDSEG